jgi:asparagine synthase (glutamine-hydrolysing)
MPGLIGYVNRKSKEHAALSLEAMGRLLEPEQRFSRDLYEESPVGLGRISLEILNPGEQPLWNEDRSLGIVMDGEFYDRQQLKKDLLARGNRIQTDSDAELALCLYQAHGDEFVAGLKGAFVLVIWDRGERKLLVANDRLGLYPLYYAQTSSGLIFAAGVRALLADSSLSLALDKTAIAEFLTFDHVLDDRTLLESVKLLPQASLMVYKDDQLCIRPYWDLQYAEFHEVRDEDADVDRLNFLLQQAVQRQVQGDRPKGLLLSGGLDSRVILALLAENISPGQLHTFTWGIPGCDDARAARELASISGTRHHFLELNSGWLADKANEAVRLTDGLGNIVNLHAFANVEEEARFAQVLFKGFLGDAMFGFAVNRYFWANYNEDNLYKVHKAAHHYHGVITFDAIDHISLFTNDFQHAVGDSVFESYRAGMKRSNASQSATQRLFFDLTQRVPRMTINGVEVVRSHAAVRLPFADYDVLDFSLQIPPGYLFNRHIAYRAFTEKYPQLAKVPNPSTGLPMISCARDILLRAKKDFQWHLRSRGLDKLAGPEKRPYKDYNTWFRTVLRNWVEGTLLDPHTLQRGLFQPDYVRQQVAGHMAGDNRAVRLGGLLSLELWLRQFVD